MDRQTTEQKYSNKAEQVGRSRPGHGQVHLRDEAASLSELSLVSGSWLISAFGEEPGPLSGCCESIVCRILSRRQASIRKRIRPMMTSESKQRSKPRNFKRAESQLKCEVSLPQTLFPINVAKFTLTQGFLLAESPVTPAVALVFDS